MKSGRFLLQVMLIAAIRCQLTESAFAGFGFGSSETSKSGLDFNSGYDINTVSTIVGRVASLPRTGDGHAVTIDAKSGSDTLHLCVGPDSFWNKSGIQVHLNDEITVKGSRAQGKDGKMYLLVQKLENRTTGEKVELRTAAGKPCWRSDGNNLDLSSKGQDSSGGRMMRGGGMMRNGGGGMMRH
jgi:hypothetical protein